MRKSKWESGEKSGRDNWYRVEIIQWESGEKIKWERKENLLRK